MSVIIYMSDPIIGIDLGTTNSCVGYFNTKTNKIEIIPMRNNSNLYPSRIKLSDGTEIYNVKRFIGKTEIDEILEREILFLPFNISCNNEKISIMANNKSYLPEEICSMILSDMKAKAEEYLKTKISKIVITVPAHFNDNQKKSTISSCSAAGLNVIGMISEPTAASIAYCLTHDFSAKIKKILIFDLGGGTLDISIIETNGKDKFEVLNTIGNVNLGGEDFTNELLVWCLENFVSKNNYPNEELIEIMKNIQAIEYLKSQIEKAKKNLLYNDKSDIYVADFYKNKSINETLTLEIFSAKCEFLFSKCIELVEKILEYGDFEKKDIDEIILVGGATRMTQIKNSIHNLFGKKPKCDINPDEAIAYGAAMYSAILYGYSKYLNNIEVNDVTPLTISIMLSNGILFPLIEKNTKIPCANTKIFKTKTSSQSSALIQLYQEYEENDEKKKYKLGTCKLTDIIGETKINITVSVDKNNILFLSVVNMSNGKQIETIFNNYLIIDKKKD